MTMYTQIDFLDGLLNQAVSYDPAVWNGVLHVATPSFTWTGAKGLADPKTGRPMRSNDQFQIASITKMMTATLLLLLAEEGYVDLDVGLSRYLPPFLIEGLHVVNGRDLGANISPRQLLSHTSGVADFFGDGAVAEDGALPFIAQMRSDPNRLWNPYDIIEWTKENLNAHFPPGHGWHYSDTGFVLAGLIIEHVTGDALHRVMRARLFGPLNMMHTYLLFREPARASIAGRDISRAFVRDAEYGATRCVTMDWACGGLVSTASDLTRFIRAFAEGRIFRDPASRTQMLKWTSTGEPGVSYGLGVRHFDLEAFGMSGAGELWGHTGFLKSFMLYWPQQDATICGALNQSEARGVFSNLRPVAALVDSVLGALQQKVAGADI